MDVEVFELRGGGEDNIGVVDSIRWILFVDDEFVPVVESVGTQALAAGDHLGARDRGSVRALAALDVDVRSLVRSVRRDGRIVRLYVAGRGRFADVTVLLGQPDDLRAKSLALRSVLLQDTLSGGAIGAIDVSVPDAPILTEK